MKANIRLNVPVDLPYRRTQIIAKKGDANSRFFAVKLTVAGNPIEITDGATARINVKREDGESKAFEGVVENGMAVCPLPAFATENGDATCTCDITVKTIIDGDKVETLTSSSFEVYVQDTACDDETIATDEERTVLDELILSVRLAEDARATAEIARQSAERDRASAEAARVAEYGNLVEQIETASAGLPAVIEAQEEARALYAQMNVALYVDEKGDLWLAEAAEQ